MIEKQQVKGDKNGTKVDAFTVELLKLIESERVNRKDPNSSWRE